MRGVEGGGKGRGALEERGSKGREVIIPGGALRACRLSTGAAAIPLCSNRHRNASSLL